MGKVYCKVQDLDFLVQGLRLRAQSQGSSVRG